MNQVLALKNWSDWADGTQQGADDSTEVPVRAESTEVPVRDEYTEVPIRDESTEAPLTLEDDMALKKRKQRSKRSLYLDTIHVEVVLCHMTATTNNNC